MLSQLELEEKYGLSPRTCSRVLETCCAGIKSKVQFGRRLYSVAKYEKYFKAAKYLPSNIREKGKITFIPPFCTYLIYLRLIGWDEDRVYETLETQGFLVSKNSKKLLTRSEAAQIWNEFFKALPKTFQTAIHKKVEPKSAVWGALLDLLSLSSVFQDPELPTYLLHRRQHRIKLEALLSTTATPEQICELFEKSYGIKTSVRDLEYFVILFHNRSFMCREDTDRYLNSLYAKEAKIKDDAEIMPIDKFCATHSIDIAGMGVVMTKHILQSLSNAIFNQQGDDVESMKSQRASMVLFHRYMDRIRDLGIEESDSAEALFVGEKYPVMNNAEGEGPVAVPALTEAKNERKDQESKAG